MFLASFGILATFLKKKASVTNIKAVFPQKEIPKLPHYYPSKKFEVAIFRQKVLACCQNIA
jgi:hypothetical protein